MWKVKKWTAHCCLQCMTEHVSQTLTLYVRFILWPPVYWSKELKCTQLLFTNVCDDILWNRFWIQITGNGIPNDRKATLQSFCPVMMTQDSLRLSKGTLALYHAATRPQHSYLLYICHHIAACLPHMWEHHRPRHFTDFFVAHFVSFRAYTALSHSWIYWLCKAAYNHGHLFQSCQLN